MYKIGLIGGADDIGRSMLYIEYNKSAIVIDSGMEFPDGLSDFGVNRIVSYGSYIKNNLSKIKGLFVTHMHEDHIGGIRRFLEKYNVPVYAEPLTCEYLKIKRCFRDSNVVIPIKHNQQVKVGQMTVRPFEVEHSTLKAFGYEIMSKTGNVVVSGDFKLGNCIADAMDSVSKWGVKERPLALLVESTNATKEGFCKHEDDIIDNIETVIRKHKDDIFIVSTFASNMNRLRNIINVAQRVGQDIFVIGRNMEIAVEFMINQEIISKSRISFLSDEKKGSIPDKALILSTGCQGEPQGGLYKLMDRLAERENKFVLFSSSVIPGNERSVNDLKIALLKSGFKYIEGSDLYHTSGHGRKEEIKCLITALKPRYVIPVHGDYIQQVANKENALVCGIPEKNIILAENNSVIKFKKQGYEMGTFDDGLEYITNNGIVKESLIETKKLIARNGVFIYSINGRFIKFSSVGVPESCKLNNVGRGFVQVFLQEHRGEAFDKRAFKEACHEYLLAEMKNEKNLPYVEVINSEMRNSHNKKKEPKKSDSKKRFKKPKQDDIDNKRNTK